MPLRDGTMFMQRFALRISRKAHFVHIFGNIVQKIFGQYLAILWKYFANRVQILDEPIQAGGWVVQC